MEWVLASASPRRKELLKACLPAFTVRPATGEETADATLCPERLVVALATQKAQEVASSKDGQGKAVVGSDTVVALDGVVFGKPKSAEDAKQMLRALSGKTHQVFTGVCVVMPSGQTETFFDRTDVTFETLSSAFIERYVLGGSPMDKAGAYGIQDGGLVKEIRGSYANVVGFPVEMFEKLLEKIGR